MRERRDIVAAFRALGPRERAVLASVVHTEGSTYRRPGARVLVLPDDATVGLVSGGCLEGDLVERARAVRETGAAQLVRYDHAGDDDLVWGLGLGCAGVVDVLLEPVSHAAPGPLALLDAWLRARRPGVLVTALDGIALGARASLGPDGAFEPGGWGPAWTPALAPLARRALEERRTRRVRLAPPEAPAPAEALVERVPAPTRLWIFGAGPDAVPVVRGAAALGWSVGVLDARPAWARAERFPEADAVVCCEPERAGEHATLDADSLALVMTHHYLHDRALLRLLLPSPSPYVGVLGPRRRTEDLLADLRAEGCAPSDEQRERLFAPAGLDVGADAPEEIALAVLAEMQAVLAGRPGGWLRDRKGPIHDPPA